MKVSSKIISGFLILMLLSVILLAYQLSVMHQMQQVNQELAEFDWTAARSALHTLALTDAIKEDTKKYFATLESIYAEQITDYLSDLWTDLGRIEKASTAKTERDATNDLREALNNYSAAFYKLKDENQTFDTDELPPDITIATDHLEAQSDSVYETIKGLMKERLDAAEKTGLRAERVSRIAGLSSLLVGVIVAWLFVRSINDPLQRLTQGTRAIAKGQFWHRLPAHGADEFAELARDFNTMSERLGELDQMKKDFVSHVSHDLKAPLASIRQIMHLLLQQIPGPLNQQQQDLTRLSYNSAERLAAMVGNLLDVSRMEAGTMEYQMAANDIVQMVKSVTDEFDIQAREKRILLRLECDETGVFAACDRDRIVQVIGNLYENALKFSPADSEIVTRVRHAKNEIVVSVSDSGPGVPDGHKQRIFQKFHQVKHGKKVAGQGVGLGLAICKTIVEAHHGQIWVEDNPNGGSVFSFALQPAASEETLKCGQPA